MPLTILILSLAAMLAGFIDSIAGGGGLILIPALILGGIPPQSALGTNKFISSLGTSTAVINFIKEKKIAWRIAAYGIPFALVGSFLGGKAILAVDEALIGKMIIFLVPIALVVTLLPKKNGPSIEITGTKLFILTAVACLAIGFYDGFFGPGTGSFLILAFHFLIKLDLIHASGTSKIFNLASGIGALIIFAINGKVLLLYGIPLAIANIIGNYLGSRLAIRHGTKFIRATLVVSLMILMVSLVVKYY